MTIKRRTLLLAGLVIAQMLVLLGIAGAHAAAERFGQEIRIKTAPVDPRDVMYGDYVVLNYDISRWDRALWKGPGDVPKRGETVYALLQKDTSGSGLFVAAGLYRSKPDVQGDGVILKGRVDYSFDNQIQVRYGLEKYYVPENTGKALEQKAGRFVATVRVAPWGEAVLTGLVDQ
jgi:uncharacterized membrane-anchored protein